MQWYPNGIVVLVYWILAYIENLCLQLQPDTLMREFELATLSAAETVFNYFELTRELDLTKKDLVHSIRGDEVKRNRRYGDSNLRIN